MKNKQKEKELNIVFTLFAVVIIIFIAGFIYVIGSTIIDSYDYEDMIIEGNVVNATYKIETEQGFFATYTNRYLYINFSDGNTYKIKTSDDLDFTVNSKMILRLRTYADTDYYFIKQIIKVPEGDT